MNTHLIGIASTLHTNVISAEENIEALRKARELALELNNLHKML